MHRVIGSARKIVKIVAIVGIVGIVATVATVAIDPVFLAQGRTSLDRPRTAFDQILDVYVRDGFVYYRALKLERAKLDSYVESIQNTEIDSAPRDEQLAFWLNAYNALVLRTVVDNYPMAQHSKDYPPRSIRQVP